MAKGKKKETLTPEERLQAALVPESEQPYKVPGNWCWTKIGCLVQILNGFAFKSQAYTDSGIRIIRISNVQDGYIEDDKPVFYPLDSTDSIAAFILKDKDLLMSLTGNVGRVAIIDNSMLPAALNQRVACIRMLYPDYNKYFLFYYFLRKEFIQDCVKNSKGSAQLNMSTEWLKKYPIPLPPLAEQQRIVDRIESLFAKLDEAKQKAQDVLDSFETRKAAILHKAFTGELTAQWRKEHGVEMESWETHELAECFEIVSGIQKTPARSPKDNPIPYLAVANVYRDKINLSDIRYFEVTPEELEKLKLQDKDILIVEGNGSGNEIGRCAMWHNELPLCIHQNHIIRMRNKTADVLPEYVLYYLNSQAGKSVMQERAKTTTGLFNLSAGKVKTIPLPFASLDEEIEIVRILDDLLVKEQQAKEAAEGVLEQINLIKKAILARAFRGELGTNDPSEESTVELL